MTIDKFRAVMLRQKDSQSQARIETISLSDLPSEDTLVKIDYTTLNYKDALALTGRGPIVKTWPMIPGVDLAGEVVESSNQALKPGTRVVLTGWSVGEKYWGGYSQYQRVKSEWLVPLPEELSCRQAMMIGTAGFEAMLCINALENFGLTPARGPVLVTGAAGGVGSVSVSILHKLGYDVKALTGDPAKHAYVASLGASEPVDGPQWSEMPKPLEKQYWAGAIDTVGTKVLARVLAQTKYGGVVASCGLAGGSDLPTTVMPFILRGVSLLGVDSVMQPTENRVKTWSRLARVLEPKQLERITSATVTLEKVIDAAHEMLDGKITGRVLVSVDPAA